MLKSKFFFLSLTFHSEFFKLKFRRFCCIHNLLCLIPNFLVIFFKNVNKIKIFLSCFMHGHFRIRTIDRIQIQPKRFGSDQIQNRNTGAHHFYLGTRHGILMHYVREQLRRLYLNVSNFPHNAAVIQPPSCCKSFP